MALIALYVQCKSWSPLVFFFNNIRTIKRPEIPVIDLQSASFFVFVFKKELITHDTQVKQTFSCYFPSKNNQVCQDLVFSLNTLYEFPWLHKRIFFKKIILARLFSSAYPREWRLKFHEKSLLQRLFWSLKVGCGRSVRHFLDWPRKQPQMRWHTLPDFIVCAEKSKVGIM